MIDVVAREEHFVDHLLPVWLALPDEARGTFYGPSIRVPGMVTRNAVAPSRNPTLVASIGDLRTIRTRPTAIMEHGCGQSFGGDPRSAFSPSYAGGAGRDAALFLHPGEHPAGRDRAAYPKARVEVVGCPKLDSLPTHERGDKPVIAVAFHWDCHVCPETRSAFRAFQNRVKALAGSDEWTVIGHGHPRNWRLFNHWYTSCGIEPVRSFAEVCARADLYVNDASSTLFEFASTGRPVVVLNPNIYRRKVNHGLRFWEASTVGVNVTEHDDLADGIRQALSDPPEQQAERERCVDLVYTYRSGGAERATAALVDWAGVGSLVAA